MPPADQIYDPGQGAKKHLTDTSDDFLAIGPALQIMQLNVEGLSASKREVISSIAESRKIDVICLEETHVDVDKTNRFSIAAFDLLAYSLHTKYGRATYFRDNISLWIMQLNVEGLSAAKREVISSIAERQKIDVICLEETHVDVDKTNRFSIAGFDLLTYALHAKYGRATYVRDNMSDAHHVASDMLSHQTCICVLWHRQNWQLSCRKHLHATHLLRTGIPQIPYLFFHTHFRWRFQ